ncbi:MAG TPA: hypothetical protein VFU71_23085 [Burkholderiaceae bacterium]|nr:hypothetical protein [Burkholderiaceae bacterium]
MATCCIPGNPLGGPFAGARRFFLSGCAVVALVSCGGGQDPPAAAPEGGVSPAGANGTDGPSIALNPPATVGQSNRIGLTWQAQGGLTSFTVLVQRAADQAFDAVDAVVSGQSAQFSRGAAYRLDFPTARVRVRGCDGSNQCVDSNEQPLLDALLAGVAHVTADVAPPLIGAKLSSDGNTLAVAAPADGPPIEVCVTAASGSVLVFHRDASGRWIQEAKLDRFDVPSRLSSLALSGDGNTLVAGSPEDIGTVGGIDPPEVGTLPPNLPRDARGAIHVYTRDAQHQWSRQAFIKPAVTIANEGFGFRIEVSHDGNRVLVGAHERMYLFEHDAGHWRQARIFESSPGGVIDIQGMAISADGSAIAVRTFGSRDAVFPSRMLPPFRVRVFAPCACGEGWQQVASLRSAKPDPEAGSSFIDNEQFGIALSFSSSGTALAIGAPGDPGGEGDDPGSIFSHSPASGAVYIFAADAGTWQQRNFLKAKTAPSCDRLGEQIALSGDGKVLLAKAIGLADNVDGIRRNHRAGATFVPEGRTCGAGGFVGVVRAASSYVFEVGQPGSWSHTAAANPAPGENVFSLDLTLSSDALTTGISLGVFPSDGGVRSLVAVY